MTPFAFQLGVVGVLLTSVVVVVLLTRVNAPYGRHVRGGWGPTVPAPLGWIVMESPSVVWFLAVFLAGPNRAAAAPLALLALWQLHYVQRTVVFPLRMRGAAPMPLSVVAMALAFNLVNATLNAAWLSHFAAYPAGWLASPTFLAGCALFLAGFLANLHSDAIVRNLRRPGETGYRIPRGGLFRWVSAPNYLAEIVEWTGFAIAAWSPAGLAFAVFTAANLGPRAAANHRWYRERFPDYPPERRALVPFLW